MLNSTLHYILPLFNPVYTSILPFSRSCTQISFLNIYRASNLRPCVNSFFLHVTNFPTNPLSQFPYRFVAISKPEMHFFFFKFAVIIIVLSRKDDKFKLWKKFLSQFQDRIIFWIVLRQ